MTVADQNVTSRFEKLAGFMSFENCILYKTTFGNFSGGFILNHCLPYSPEEYYYLDTANNILVLFSGCIYNQQDILNQINLTEKVKDPRLIALAFLKLGPEFVKNLNGDFAIIIYQSKPDRLFLFRDHAGIRPLAYTVSGSSLFVSSDISGLCRAFNQKYLDREYLCGQFKNIDLRLTANKQVVKLLNGHYLEYVSGKINIIRYWHPEKIRTDKSLKYEIFLQEIESILKDAVKIRCDSRFSAGAHVSSGLDSGIVSTLARKEYASQEQFYGFSWSSETYTPDNIEFDERDMVRKTCEMAGISPVFSQISKADFIRNVSHFMYNQSFYIEDYTLKQANNLKTNLIFSGWGGDEFISKSNPGIDSDLFFGFHWQKFFRRNPVKYPKKLARTILYGILFPVIGVLDFSVRKSFKEDTRYLKKPFKKPDLKVLKKFFFYRSRRENHLGYLEYYHIQNRCEIWAVNGYRHGVEYRYPLLDKRIIEYMLKVPSELLSRSYYHRIIIREISNGLLPEEVRWKWQGTDPVFFAQNDQYIKEAAIGFIKEVSEWKVNPDLYFIDFESLERDFESQGRKPGDREFMNLCRTIVNLKALHEFTKIYHSQTATR